MRTRIGVIVAGLLVVLGLAAARADAQPPNVLMVMLDDATAADVGYMPNVQADLVAHGTTFRNSFVSFSLCCPSRATYFTGQYAHNSGVTGGAGYRQLDDSETLAVWLHDAGYRTDLVGKYLNGYGTPPPGCHGSTTGDCDPAVYQTVIPPGWDHWHADLTPSDQRVYDFDLSEDGQVVHYGTNPGDYRGRVITNHALALLRHSPPDQPFYLSVAYQVPHRAKPDFTGGLCAQAANPAPGDLGAHDDVPLPMDPSFNEADVSDKPPAIQQLHPLTIAAIARLTRQNRCRLDSLLSADRGVGKIVEELATEGRLDSTLILLTSDNGFMQGQHRVANGKVLPYEPSIRVPLIARGPGFAEGAKVRAPVANIDYAPTFLRAAGATATGRAPDGVSLQDVATGLYRRRDVALESYVVSGHSIPFHGVRTPHFVYIVYEDGERELYDLAADPYELDNRAGDPRYAATEAWLAQRTTDLETCSGTACSVLVGDPPPPAP